MNLNRIVLDVVKGLSKPSLISLASEIVKVRGVSEVNISVNDTDIEVMSLAVSVNGSGISYESLIKNIEETGCAIRSIDEINVSKDTRLDSRK